MLPIMRVDEGELNRPAAQQLESVAERSTWQQLLRAKACAWILHLDYIQRRIAAVMDLHLNVVRVAAGKQKGQGKTQLVGSTAHTKG